MNPGLVSIVIPTYNSGRFIGKCLDSLNKQTYPQIEIIVVDDPLTADRTREISQAYGARVIVEPAGVAESRNIGVRNARGEFIYHIDSDMELTPTVVEESVGLLENSSCGGVIVPEVSVGETFWAKCKGFEKCLILMDDDLEAARFYRKKVFDTVGLYDPKLEAAEDYDFSLRARQAGFKFCRCKSVVYHHEGELTLFATMRKKYRYGLTIGRYLKKHRGVARRQFFPLRRAYFRNGKMFIEHPVLGVGFVVMKLCEYAAGGVAFCRARLGYEHPL
ncbi:MAG: glycosyltransferase [Candidatus Omnitrophota bacterium]